MNALWEIVLSNALLVVVLATGVAVAGRFWKNPLGLHLLWLLVLLKFVTPPLMVIGLPLPVEPSAVVSDQPTSPSPGTEATSPGEEVSSSNEMMPAAMDRQIGPLLSENTIAHSDAGVDSPPQVAARERFPWLIVLTWIWCIGIVCTVLWQARRILRFQRLLRAAEPASSDLLRIAVEVSQQLGLRQVPPIRMLPVRISPLVWSPGFRPQLVLPMELFQRLEPAAQCSILAHELAHVRRKDHLARLLELLVSTLFWWHPVAWWACRELKQIEELCCDAMVVGMAPSSRKAYVTALLDTLDFLCDGSIAAPLGATAAKSPILLARRIAMMKNRTGDMRLTFGRVVLLVLAAAVPMAIAFAGKQPQNDGMDSTKSTANGPTEATESTVASPQTVATLNEKAKPSKELSVDLGVGIKLELVLVPAGEFLMGTPEPDEEAFSVSWMSQHPVRITKPFYLGKYKVTKEEWQAVMGDNSGHSKEPKHELSFDDCQKFLKKLNANYAGGRGKFTLPTEAQWEYACRAGSKTRYFFGDDKSQLDEYAFDWKPEGNAHAVKPNAWGLYDMYGNVYEWCADWWARDVDNNNYSLVNDPSGPHTGRYRVAHGGHDGSAFRFGIKPSAHDTVWLGLRVCLVPVEAVAATRSPSANDQSGKTSAVKPADEVSPASDETATKGGSETEYKPVADQGLTALEPNADGRAIAEIEKLGGDLIAEVIQVKLGGLPPHYPQVTDADLQHLQKLHRLQRLHIESTKVTDAGLQNLKGLSQLQILVLVCPKVTDAGLQNLKGLGQLRLLMFNHTHLTDSGLEHLKGFGYLQKLWFIDTQVTDEGVKKLRQSLPHCEIWHGRDQQDLMRHLPFLSSSAANDEPGKTSAAKSADGVSSASDRSAVKEGSTTESKPSPAQGVTAESNTDEAIAIAEIVKLGGKVTFDEKSPGRPVISVDLNNVKMTDAGLEPFQGLTNLQFLDLSHTEVTDAGLKHLQGLTKLQALGLVETKVTNAGLAHLKGMTQLKSLNLMSTKITDSGLENLKGLVELRFLCLKEAQVTDTGLEHLKGLTKLQDLDLGGTKVTDAGLERVKGMTKLQTLNLRKTQVTDAGLAYLTGLTQLQMLDLEGTQVTGAGMENLKALTNLIWLSLAATKVTDAGLEHFKGLTKLANLNLSGTQVTDAGLEHLKGLANLKYLRLAITRVTDAGLEHLKGSTGLEQLDLSGTQVTDSGLENLKALTKLEFLTLRGTKVSKAGIQKTALHCIFQF